MYRGNVLWFPIIFDAEFFSDLFRAGFHLTRNVQSHVLHLGSMPCLLQCPRKLSFIQKPSIARGIADQLILNLASEEIIWKKREKNYLDETSTRLPPLCRPLRGRAPGPASCGMVFSPANIFHFYKRF